MTRESRRESGSGGKQKELGRRQDVTGAEVLADDVLDIETSGMTGENQVN